MLSIRKIGVLGRTYRHLNRYRQILQILFKYGFDDLIDRLGIEQYLEIGLKIISRRKRKDIKRLSQAERIREVLVELGPTFIKMGQVLSTRTDLIPLEYILELSKLQDRVPPFSYDQVCQIFDEEFGKSPEELFQSFEKEPEGSASIGQVHKAQLFSDELVAVKVQRPGIKKIIEIDLEILMHLATLAEKHLEEFEAHRPTKIIKEFARSLERELDYSIEAVHIERFNRQFADDQTIYVPKVYRDLSSKCILVMEYVSGIKATEIERIREKGYDLKKLARRGTDLVMKQIFVHGFFHADPHPGNVWVLPNDTICFLDFGMMGRITTRERDDFVNLAMQVVQQDEHKTTSALLKILTYQEEPNREELERDIANFIEDNINRSLKEVNAAELMQHLLTIVRRYNLSIKSSYYMMLKALAGIEIVGKTWDPDFQVIERAEPFIRRIYLRRFHPKHIAKEMFASGSEFINLVKTIPDDMGTLLTLAKKGKIKIQFEHHRLDDLQSTFDRVSNRISYAIVLAALVIGSSLIVHSDIPPKWNEIPVIGLVGFLVAGIMGFVLLWSILRRGQM
jgi:ubiquinone biosynthesis protein